MAKIPTLGPGSAQLGRPKISTKSPSAMQTQTIGAGKGIAALGSDIAQSASYMYQKMDEARNFTEIAQAEVADARMLAGELMKAETAVDKIGRPRQGSPEDFKDHDEIFKQSGETIGGYFSNKETEVRYESERQKNIIATRTQIARKYNQNMIDAGKAALLNKINDDVEIYNVISAEQRPAHIKRVKNDIAEGVRLGFITALDEQKLVADSEERMRTGLVYFDADRDLTGTLDELKKGTNGIYADLTSKERSELIDSMGRKIRRDQLISAFQDNRQKDEHEAKTLVAWADGTLTEQQIKDGLLSLRLRRPFAEKMFKQLYADPNVKTDFRSYIKIRGMQIAGSPTSDINQAILDNGDKLSTADKKVLIEKTFSETDKQQKEKIKYNRDALHIWAVKNLSIPDKDLAGDVVYEFHRRVDNENAQGNRIDEIAQEVIKDKIKEYHPSTALSNDVPNFIAERNSLKRVYEKNSKLKGKAPTPKPSVITGGSGIDFDDL